MTKMQLVTLQEKLQSLEDFAETENTVTAITLVTPSKNPER